MPNQSQTRRCRVRDLGIEPGVLPTGKLNAITDVKGVRVGHTTIIEGESIQTGVTAILPHGGNVFQDKVFAGCAVGNGFGKTAGLVQVRELGIVETPIVLTSTLAVGTAMIAVVRWTLAQQGNEDVTSINAVVGECNEGLLNDARAMRVREEDVVRAIEGATPQATVEEGNVGAGTGVTALGFKAGIGTSSRALPGSLGGWTVGAIVQPNFGGVLRIDGIPVGELTGRHVFSDHLNTEQVPNRGSSSALTDDRGSCMIVLATDAPLSPRQLNRLASRAFLGMARTGAFMSNGSGDVAITFSTAQTVPHASEERTINILDVRDDAVSPLLLAAVEATEEAIYNGLTMSETMTGHQGRTVEEIDLDLLRKAVSRR
jgi:D-aminopeptidase